MIRLFSLLTLVLVATGCASSGIAGSHPSSVGTFSPPEGYVPGASHSVALSSVNAGLEAGRFALEMTDGRKIAVRSVALGPVVTRVALPRNDVRYLPTAGIARVTSGADQGSTAGAVVGALPGAIGLGLLLSSRWGEGCEDDGVLDCAFAQLQFSLLIVMAATLLAMGSAAGSRSVRRSQTTIYYLAPITRYLLEPPPSATSDL